MQEPPRGDTTARKTARTALMVRVVLDNLTILKDLAHGLVRYIFGYHLLVAVDSHTNIVCAGLLAKPGNDI